MDDDLSTVVDIPEQGYLAQGSDEDEPCGPHTQSSREYLSPLGAVVVFQALHTALPQDLCMDLNVMYLACQ
jgi:hypothetical protein